MKDILKAGLVASVMLSATMAHAGGPVLIEEGNDELIEEAPNRQIGILPVLGLLVLAGLLAGGGGGGGVGGGTVVGAEPQDPPKVFPAE